MTVSTQKNGVSDTSKNYVQFNDLADVSAIKAIITFKNSIYDHKLVGVYIITINYSWNQSPVLITTITVTLIDPCLVAVVPQSLPSFTYYNGDPDTTKTLAPIIISAYWGVCLYSISIAVSKSTTPDTSSTVIAFTPMVNALYENIGDAYFSLH